MRRLIWKIDEAYTCSSCGKKQLRRSERGYRVFAKVYAVTALVIFSLMRYGDRFRDLPLWEERIPSRIMAFIFYSFLASLIVIGCYETYDRLHSYRCLGCGYVKTVPARKFSGIEKVVFALLLFLLGVLFFLLCLLIGSWLLAA